MRETVPRIDSKEKDECGQVSFEILKAAGELSSSIPKRWLTEHSTGLLSATASSRQSLELWPLEIYHRRVAELDKPLC